MQDPPTVLILTVLKGPDKGRRFELPDDEPQQIGRSGESLPLTDQTISRRHAELTPDEGRWYITDLQSANGTFVNGKRVEGRRRLNSGDQVRTGNTLMVFGRDAQAMGRSQGVRVRGKREIDAVVEAAVPSNEDSMIMAVPDPGAAAVVQLRVVYELTQLLGSELDRQRLLERVMVVVFEHFQADRGFILLLEGPDNRPVPVVVRHRRQQPGVHQPPITVSRTIVQHVLKKNEGVLSSNAMADKRFASGESVQRYAIRSALCVPIQFKDRLFGVIYLDSQVANYTYTEDQLRLLTAVGVQTGLALSNEDLYRGRVQRERLAAVGQTVAALSHSIKNIIQGLRGGAEVVELGLRKDNMNIVKGGWEIVARNLERISNLTMNMLAFSKTRRPELELTSVPRIIEDAVALVQRQFDAKKVALITEFEPDMPPLPMDPTGMHQAVLNLLSNALEAVQPESGVVTLRCDYAGAEQPLRLSVADNGAGMDAQTRENLFEPFYSTKGMRGTGLGLVVTKKVVEEHSGTIEIDSSPGKGTTLTLIIPTTVRDNAASAETLSPASPPAPAVSNSPGRPGAAPEPES